MPILIKEQINKFLKSSNGSRRTRLLDEADIIRLISEAMSNENGATTGGGTVANAYSKKSFSPAYQTVACALKKDKEIFVKIGVNSASRGASQVPDEVGHASNRLKNWDGKSADFKLNIGQARRLVNNWRKERGEILSLPENLKSVIVSKEDSILAGNCSAYTDKISQEIGKEIGSANELFLFVKRKYPDQLLRAVRAIKYAAAKPVGV